MASLPDVLVAQLARTPEAGAWYPIHQLLTAADGPPAVCLLSAAEMRASGTGLSVASRSSRAATNLAASGTATLVAWADGLHYVTLALRSSLRREGLGGYRFEVVEVRTDDIGIELQPLRYRMEPWLARAERWDLTRAVLDELDRLGDT